MQGDGFLLDCLSSLQVVQAGAGRAHMPLIIASCLMGWIPGGILFTMYRLTFSDMIQFIIIYLLKLLQKKKLHVTNLF